MSNIFHTGLEDRWNDFTIYEQMANIGAEVGRAINWTKKNNITMKNNAIYRALELIDFTVVDKKNSKSLKEILRVREALVDYFIGDNLYKSSDEIWQKYFYFFNSAARKNH